MKKKPPVADRPLQSQIDAIRRRITAGNAHNAREEIARIDALRREFPHYKPLLALAWEAARESGDETSACLAAWDWTQASPNSAVAWEALAESARTRFPALMVFARNKSDALNGRAPSVEFAAFETPFGPLSFQQAVRMDTCRMLMDGCRLDEAEAAITGLDHVTARNNLALLTFARGEPERALEQLEANWRATPDNLFGLERMIRLRLWTRGMDYAAGLGAPLAATRPLRGDDLRAKLAGLILLDRFKEADAAWSNAEQEHIQSSREIDGDCHYMAAYAAWRLGKEKEALARLRAAGKNKTCNAMAEQLLDARKSKDTPDWELSDLAAWWPLSNINAIRREESSDAQVRMKILERFSPHNDYLERMAEQGGSIARLIALALLQSRAHNGDAAAVASLKRLLSRPCGPDKVRHTLQTWLMEAGFMDAEEIISGWFNGEVRTVRQYTFRIVNTPADVNLPLEDAKRYERATGYHFQGKHTKAESEMSALLAAYPRHPRILANLAIMRINLNHPLAEVEKLAKLAYEIDPGYAFSRIALAYVLIFKREPKEALKILEPILDQEEIHIIDWRACLSAQKMAAEAMGETGFVNRLSHMIAEAEAMYNDD